MTVFAHRLKEARRAAGSAQERLGVLAGIDEASASARMNQYERGKHHPDFSMVERLATALNVPEGYFYTKDDALAYLLISFHRATDADKAAILQQVRS